MSYSHLTPFERGRLESLYRLGWSTRAIGEELNRHHSTIAREIKRNLFQFSYHSVVAHERYNERRKASVPRGKWTPALARQIEEKLEATWSPEQIAATVAKGKVCFKTIYRWIYLYLLSKGNLGVLRHKGKRQNPKERRGTFQSGKSIHTRPSEVKQRQSFGHWELDTIVSSRQSKGCLGTFVERKTRMYIAVKMKDRTSESMDKAIKSVHSSFPPGTFQTFTVDNGKEFACFSSIEKGLNTPMYFADPYASWQRGSNENANGLLREFFPKKTDLAKVSLESLTYALRLIANRPRKCLGWKTSYEAFMDELSHLA